ncbi:MAG TPA: hypothetical protein DDW27_21270 [Bacteroidales bacterium]|nr:hypothetical protein [Bacteroidales bacterium]
MLHDPGSYSPPVILEEINLTESEKTILRRLGQEIAGIAALPVHKEKARLWTRLNDLKSERPMVWINEIPWHEMNVNDELTIQTTNTWAREFEQKLRREIYQWKHMPGDMIVNNYIECPLAIHSTDFGIVEDVDIVRTDDKSDIYSRHFNVQIKEPEDIEKIKMPRITHYEKTTNAVFETMNDLFKDIIPVRKVGQTHIWFTPWDYLIRWWGVEEAMIDLVMRPDMVNAAVERMTDAWICELDQFAEQNLLSLDNNNTRIGSGGYGYTSDLPGNEFDPTWIKPQNMWGCSNAQILVQVSSEMHWEFALKHEMRWLEKWGLTYYGCCEPLDTKLDIMRRIPNLRKISVSPWADLDTIVREVGDQYVLSVKPSPAIFAADNWDPHYAGTILENIIRKTQGVSHVELILKDISTVGYHPENLWEWEKIAMDVVENTRHI